MNVDTSNFFIKWCIHRIQHYNPERYWRMRSEVVNPDSKVPKWLRYIYLYRIKKSDAFNNASMGTDMGQGASFASPPILMHGLNGIFIGHGAQIGKNVTICHQVSIEQGRPGMPVIGDNVFIGVGAKILNDVVVGDNVTIGANAVVTRDIPPNSVVAGVPARIIKGRD